MNPNLIPTSLKNNTAEENPPQTVPYKWKSVVVGGGGFIPGIIFHPSVKGLCYLRTDMGGAYRREKGSGAWECLTDMFGKDEADYNGVLSLAVDPNDPDTVYMMNGKYTFDRDRRGAFHISRDRGNTWKRVPLEFKVGGNEPGRGAGERIAVDPNQGSIIFMGSTRDGMWKSGSSGLAWEKVTGFFPLNVNFILFDKSSGAPGTATKRIFAGTADTTGKSLFVSTDGGNKWANVQGQPAGVMALRADISGGSFYASFSDTTGPYGVTKGSAWKYAVEGGKWEKLNLPEGEGGFSGIAVDASDPGHLLVSTLNRYKPCDEIYQTYDSGRNWTGILENADWDRTSSPYTGTITPHWIADVKIDPFDSMSAMWVTGYGVWKTNNLPASTVKWHFDDDNIEQTVAMQIISPPAGAHLISAMGDIDGFSHHDPGAPTGQRHKPEVRTTLAVSFAWMSPEKIAKAYNSRPPFGAYSVDGGKIWVDFLTNPAGTKKGGLRSIAMSADGAVIVWSPEGASMSYSEDGGGTWAASGGGMAGRLWPFSDTQNPDKFYAYDGVLGILWQSRDRGKNFTVVLNDMPKEASYPGGDGMAEYMAAAVPRAEGEVWLASGRNGLFRFKDTEGACSRIKNVQEAYRLGFGKEAPGKLYPSIYIWAKISGITGFFRSDDEGMTWARINDDRRQYGWIHCITGDPRVYGRCYMAAEGRGVLYGEEIKL
jgi:photosystem II stability/assembly factor-like uncharacterized protein